MKNKDKINALEEAALKSAEKIGFEIGERRKALEIAKALLDVLDEETIAQKTGYQLTR